MNSFFFTNWFPSEKTHWGVRELSVKYGGMSPIERHRQTLFSFGSVYDGEDPMGSPRVIDENTSHPKSHALVSQKPGKKPGRAKRSGNE